MTAADRIDEITGDIQIMKKKRFTGTVRCFLLAFTFLFTAGQQVFAASDKVVDMAGLLSQEEEERLEKKLSKVVETYDCDVAVVTTDSTGGLSPMTYADNYYENNGYGVGPDRDGLLLLISMEARDWWITTWGSAIDTFTDYGIEVIGDEIVGELSDADYYEAFMEFAGLTDDFLKQAQQGEPYDVYQEYKAPFPFAAKIAIACGIGFLAALLTLLGFRAQLRSVSYEKGAHQYVRQGSFHLTRSKDLYLYRTVTRTKIERPDPPSGHGGGGSHTHTTSGGSRAGGGGGKF